MRTFLFSLIFLYTFSVFSEEPLTQTYLTSTKDFEEPRLFTPDQLATLVSDTHQLIGDIVSPLSGNPCLRQTDFTVIGAQGILLSRVYVAPYMPHSFDKDGDRDCYFRNQFLRRNYDGWKFFPHMRL